MKIIVIDDERIKRVTLADALTKAGHPVEAFESPFIALSYFEQWGADVIVTDIRMKGIDGIEVLKRVKKINPNTSVIMMTAYGTVDSAVQAMKLGAHDYITKPFSSERLILVIEKLEKVKELLEENVALKKQLQERFSFHNLVGKSKVMQELYGQIETIAKTEATVLIEGESGTGKELVANAIHYNSNRKLSPFIKLSCAVLNESLLESELFGHEKGAFTGAYKEKKGKFELANEGTLFLDDVDDIPLSFQVKLLRVLQEQEFERVGGNKSIKVNVRLICATKSDLWQLVTKGKFREDLYYRLKVVPIKLPPLRERREDIPLLIDHFISEFEKPQLRFSPEAIGVLMGLNYSGNVRELKNIIQRIITLARDEVITEDMIPEDVKNTKTGLGLFNSNDIEIYPLDKILEDIETQALKWAFDKAQGNQTKAAEILHIKRTTLHDKMKKYGLI